jgi:hypothetical protein
MVHIEETEEIQHFIEADSISLLVVGRGRILAMMEIMARRMSKKMVNLRERKKS